MANIAFKRGLQASLAASTFKVDDGTFYLTTDSHRLYVGQGSELVDLNKYIKEVKDTTELMNLAAENGDFVYVKEGNMLVVCTDKTGSTATTRWTQINAYTNTNTDQWLDFDKVSVKGTEGTDVTATLDFVKHNKDVITGKDSTTPVQIDITISRANLATALAMDVEAKVENNVATIITSSGTEEQGEGFTISGGTNVTISGEKDALVISAVDTNTTYDLVSPANSTAIKLTGNDGSEDVVTLKSGDLIALDGSVEKEITIKHGEVTINEPTNVDGGTLSHEGTFTVLDSVVYDNYGHITGTSTKTYTLPQDNNTTNTSVKVEAGNETTTELNAGDLKVSVTDSAGQTKAYTLEQGLYVKVDGEKIYNQSELTDAEYFVNLSNDVEQLKEDLSGIDALRYRGTLGAGGTVSTLPSENVQIGDTYKVAVAGVYGGITCELGDLLIATGTEDADGYITGPIDWTLVAQGSDTDTTYTLSGASNKITLTASTGGNTGEIIVEGGTDITTAVAGNKLSVTHNNIIREDDVAEAAETLAHEQTIDVVTNVNSSDTGHITGITVKKYKMPSDNNTTYTLPASQVTADSHSKITLTSGGTGAGVEDVVNFKADRNTNTSLKVSGTADTITFGHTDYAYTAPTTTAGGTLAHGGKLQVVTGATVDNGHVTSLTTTEYTLPVDNDTTYTLSGAVTEIATVDEKASAIKITDTLSASSGSSTNSAYTVTSNSLKLTAGSKSYNIDLEWGTF